MNKYHWQEFVELVAARRSVRGFKEDCIAQDTLQQIFSVAQQAPSNCNTQPWQLGVVSGEAAQDLKQAIKTAIAAGEYSMDFPYSGQYVDVYQQRQYQAAASLYQAMGIERGDKAGRAAAFDRNFDFFDAPHAAFLFLPEGFAEREAADLGMYAQTLMLALSAAGYASCPMTSLSFNADVVREYFDFPAAYRLMFGICFGYEDEAVAANQARTERAQLADVVKFLS